MSTARCRRCRLAAGAGRVPVVGGPTAATFALPLLGALRTLVIRALALALTLSRSGIALVRAARRRRRHLRFQEELVDAQLLLVVAAQLQLGDSLDDLLPVVVVVVVAAAVAAGVAVAVAVADVAAVTGVAAGVVLVQVLPAVWVVADAAAPIPGQLLQGGT